MLFIMTTTEKNIVIAEFRGWKLQNNPDERWFNHWFNENGYREDKLHFDNDWILLMDVVEKIESLGYRVTIIRHLCRIDLTEESKLLISEDLKKIEAVYTVCFKFIQWYNQNKI